MKKYLTVIFFTIFLSQAYAQLYNSDKGPRMYYAEIINDSAHVEIFNLFRYFKQKEVDTVICISDSKKDASLGFSSVAIFKFKESYRLRYKNQYWNRTKTVRMIITDQDYRINYRNDTYFVTRSRELNNLIDSLSGPNEKMDIDRTSNYSNTDLNLKEQDRTTEIDQYFDSLTAKIDSLRSPIVDIYYQKSDAIGSLDSTEIFSLLAEANYKFDYANYFLNILAIERPEALIAYIDSSPLNKEVILKAIKNHRNFKEMTKSVKATPIRSDGKKKIVRQKTKRIAGDIAAGTLSVTISLAILAIPVFIGILIFR